MLSSKGFQRIIFIIIIVGATNGQRRQAYQQQSRDHYELAPVHLVPNHFVYSYSSPLYEQQQYVTLQNPTHQNQHFKKGNGNGLSTTEIAMEILGDIFPLNIENSFDANKYDQYYERLPSSVQKDLLDIFGKEHNFRRLTADALTPTTQQQHRRIEKRQEKIIPRKADWHENTLGYENDNDDNDSVGDADDNPAVKDKWLAFSFLHVNNGALTSGSEYESNLNNAKTSSYDEIPCSENENKESVWQKSVMKRNPLAIDNHRNTFAHPHYPFAFYKKGARGIAGATGDKHNYASNYIILRNSKRERMRPLRTTFIPSVSTGSMTHLGNFFNDLSKNVRFNERNQFPKPQEKLLQGDHPLRMLQSDVDDEADEQIKIEKTADFLQAIRSYRPSQKIRSLVSMNPQGYHGSNFLDPNYMWVGLG